MKLTPSIYNSIKELAISLPAVHRVDTNGNFLYQHKSKSMLWDELSEEQKKKATKGEDTPIYKNKAEKAKGNVLFYKPCRYIMNWKEPIKVNHEVLLVIEFKKGGLTAVQKYAKYVNEMTIKSLEQQRLNNIKNGIENTQTGPSENTTEESNVSEIASDIGENGK